jgi:glutathione S-transferase
MEGCVYVHLGRIPSRLFSHSGVLVRKDDQERKDHFQSLIGGLARLSKELLKTPGPLFLADSRLSSVDLALFPWAFRFYVLEHYRGPEFKIPETPELEPYHAWYRHMVSLACVQRTLFDQDKYLDHIRKYADGSARSKVAEAVRRGAAAHDLDDEKDEYKDK